jgi:hypothetical protein
MVKVDLNRVSVAGLVLGAVAAILLTIRLLTRSEITVGGLLGENAPFAKVPIYWAVALVALLVYLVGRVIQLHRDNYGMPRRPDRGEDGE